jgi:type IV pilus assembly protein PilN
MTRINLLPWREDLRKQRQQRFLMTMLFSLLVAAAVMFGWRLLVTSQIDYQKQRNEFLRAEIRKVDELLKEIEELDKVKARILARMQVIQDLQARRPEAVHLMDELVTTMPEGVHLDSITQNGQKVSLNGRAQSNARVSALMRNAEASPWLESPNLQIVQNKGEDKDATLSEFKLQIQQKRAKPAAESRPEKEPAK